MNILFITGEIPYPENSGARIYTWQRIKQLSKYNDINLMSLVDDENIDYEEIGKYCNMVKVFKRNKDYKYIFKNFYKPYTMISRYNKEMYEEIVENVKKFDLVIIDNIHMICNIPLSFKTKILITQHNIEWKLFGSIAKGSNNIIKKFIYNIESFKLKKYEKYLYQTGFINASTFISTEDEKFFQKEIKLANVDVIPNGCNLEILNENTKREIIKKNKSFNIVFTGKMNYEPNVQAVQWFMDNIFENIVKKVPNTKFFIVGKDPVSQIKAFNSERVIVTGEVESVKPYLEFADLVVIPLQSGGGVKIKLLEALSSSNIVVTTDKGNEGTNFEHNKHLLVTNKPEEFTNYCVDVLKNRKKFEFLVENSLINISKNYNWNDIGYRYNEFIKNI